MTYVVKAHIKARHSLNNGCLPILESRYFFQQVAQCKERGGYLKNS